MMALLILASLLTAQQQGVEHAWRLAANGQRDTAIELLRTLLSSNPRNADAHLLIGSLLMEKDERFESIQHLTEGVRLRPRSADAQNALGEAYDHFGEFKNARSPFEKAVLLNPRFAQARINLALVLLQGGEPAKAATHLDRAIALLGRTKDSAYAHYLRAKAYSDPQGAIAHLETAVALDPMMAEAWSDLGQARKVLLRDNAFQAFQRAVELDPKGPIAQYRLGSEYLYQGKLDKALEHLQESYRLDPKDQSTLNGLQITLRQLGRILEANNIKSELAELLRQHDVASQNAVKAVTINNQGAQLEKAGDLRAASEKYKAAVDLYPEHIGIRVNYAVVLLRLGQWTLGLNELHEALRRDPGNSKVRAAFDDALSQAPAGTVPQWHDLPR
jgi:tetratricopeptide (TPR) repeat protein